MEHQISIKLPGSDRMNGANGFYDPLVDTGRGSWAFFSKTTLDRLLEIYDEAACLGLTDKPRSKVIEGWKEAKVVFRNSNRLGEVA
jgi:hypothetical protein